LIKNNIFKYQLITPNIDPAGLVRRYGYLIPEIKENIQQPRYKTHATVSEF
jgi:hypothetical protein